MERARGAGRGARGEGRGEGERELYGQGRGPGQGEGGGRSPPGRGLTLKVISRSRPTNSVMCRCVRLFSERKTGPISKTLPRSAMSAICLYSCGDCAR